MMISDADALNAATAIRAGRGAATDYLVLGWYQYARGDHRGSEAMFLEAIGHAPDHPLAHLSLSAVLRARGQLSRAIRHCDAALAIAPDMADAWLERGNVMVEAGDARGARACFSAAITRDADNAAAHAGLARIAARQGDPDVARDHGDRALAIEPHNATALAALAIVALDNGDAEGARTLLAPAVAAIDRPSPERASLSALLAEATEACGDPGGAEHYYALSNADFVAYHAGHIEGLVPIATAIARIADDVERTFPRPGASVSPVAASGVRREGASKHVFVLGHPRSGNTLIEHILSALPGASTLEEQPTLRAAFGTFLADGGLTRLATLDEAAVEAERDAYWAAVRVLGGDPEAALVIDMDPLKSLGLPIIGRLFPEALVLRILRDPRDVVWSCYRTYFALTNSALAFATIEGAARHYAATMQLIETAQRHFAIDMLDVRYEAVVSDFDQATRTMTDFIGIEWSEDLRRFDARARQRGVTTASDRQVRKGLFDGRRQWERHAGALAPALPILSPWIKKFGYQP